MANILPKTTFKEWAKDPKTAMLILMGTLLTVFVYAFTHSNNGRVDDCKEEVQYLRSSKDTLEKQRNYYQNKFFDESEKNIEIISVLDSVIHYKTEFKAKKLLQ